MARTVLTITSDLFNADELDQEASIRENLPVRTLLAETRREFNLPDGNYGFKVKGSGKILDPEKTLEQSGIHTGAVLVLTRERRAAPVEQNLSTDFSRKMPLTGPYKAALREEEIGQTFEIKWQPAIIGRPDAANPDSIEMLAVNLGPFEGSKTVSRFHARITEQGGQFFIESITDNNPTYLNDGLIRMGERRFLQTGDKIRVGKFEFTFTIRQ
jgi:hypothetical protein